MFQKGITLNLLRRVFEFVSSPSDDENHLTVHQFCERFVKIWTQSSQLSFIEHFLEQYSEITHPELQISAKSCIKDNPNLYICHTWGDHFHSLISSIEEYCKKQEQESVDHQEIVIWIDVFCINQWDQQQIRSDFLLNLLPAALERIGRMIVVLPSIDSESILTSRTWCLWEIFHSSLHLLEFDVSGSKDSIETFQKSLRSVNVLSSVTSNDYDRTQILQAIEQFYEVHHKSVPNRENFDPINEFNKTVLRCFEEWLSNCDAAVRAASSPGLQSDDRPNMEIAEVHLENLSISEVSQKESDSHTLSTSQSVGTESHRIEGTLIEMGNETLIMFECPYKECQGVITVAPNQVNCGVFRHGVYKNSGRPIGPHLSEEKCLELIKQGKVYGCAQPFRVQKFLKLSYSDPQTSNQSESIPQKGENETTNISRQRTKNKKNPNDYHYYIEKCGYI